MRGAPFAWWRARTTPLISRSTASTSCSGATEDRQGCPGTGAIRGAAQPARRVLVAQEFQRHAVGGPADGRHHRGEQARHRRSERGRQVRGPGVSGDQHPALARTPARVRRSVRPPRSRAEGPATVAVSLVSLGPPVTTTRCPAPSSSSTAAAWCSAGQARAGADAPGWTTIYGSSPTRSRTSG